jgi:hypothetical protein
MGGFQPVRGWDFVAAPLRHNHAELKKLLSKLRMAKYRNLAARNDPTCCTIPAVEILAAVDSQRSAPLIFGADMYSVRREFVGYRNRHSLKAGQYYFLVMTRHRTKF